MPEIAAAAVDLAAEMTFAAFAWELLGNIRRNAASGRLKRALGFVVEVLWDRAGFVGRRLRWHDKLLGSEAKRIIAQNRRAPAQTYWQAVCDLSGILAGITLFVFSYVLQPKEE